MHNVSPKHCTVMTLADNQKNVTEASSNNDSSNNIKQRSPSTLTNKKRSTPTPTNIKTMAAMAVAETEWLTASRVKIKLKSNGDLDLNTMCDAGVLPDDLNPFDNDGNPVVNSSFLDIAKFFSLNTMEPGVFVSKVSVSFLFCGQCMFH